MQGPWVGSIEIWGRNNLGEILKVTNQNNAELKPFIWTAMHQSHINNTKRKLHNQLFIYTLLIKFTHMLNVSVSYFTKQSMSKIRNIEI